MKLTEHWSTYLAPDPELERIKEGIEGTTRVIKAHNEDTRPRVLLPLHASEWRCFWKKGSASN